MTNEPSNAYDILNDHEEKYSNPQEPLYAGFWKRAIASIIDGIIMAVVTGIVIAFLFFIHSLPEIAGPGPQYSESTKNTWTVISAVMMIGVTLFFPWLYTSLYECSKSQATPGKMAVGIIVVDERHTRISFGRATARYWSQILSGIFYIGYMMAGWTARKQALHDLIAGTLVVNRDELQKIQSKQAEYEQYKRENQMTDTLHQISG